MSFDLDPVFSGQRLDTLALDDIEHRLGRLIRQYVHTRSPTIALSVVRHLDCLCTHPAFESDPKERCAYLRLRMHWRWLAHAQLASPKG